MEAAVTAYWIAIVLLLIFIISGVCSIAIGHFFDAGTGDEDPEESAMEPRADGRPWEEYELDTHRPLRLVSHRD